MASYDNLMALEQPWLFRPEFFGSWIPDVFSKETETMAKALQNSFATNSSYGDVFSDETLESLFSKPEATPSGSCGSENEAPVLKQSRRSVPPSGRVAKRKSRASKRASTTYIVADPANFRQMVQQVTGLGFDGLGGQLSMGTVCKPEPHKGAVNPLPIGGGSLPTLDTSAFLLGGSATSPVVAGGGAAPAERYLDSFCSFPTLESWKAT